MVSTSKHSCAQSSDDESSTTETATQSSTNKNISVKSMAEAKKGKGAATYRVAYKTEWGKEFPIRSVPNDRHKFHCISCGKNVSCHHQGLGDVKVHCNRDVHKKNLATLKKQKTLHCYLFLGGTTKFTLNRLRNDGTISEADYKKIHEAAHHYFKNSLKYILDKFPINSDVLCNAVWVNVPERLNATWENVQFFLDKFSSLTLLESINFDELYDEFVDYQTLTDDSIGKRAWEEAKVLEGTDEDENEIGHNRVDILWWHLAHLKIADQSMENCFKHLPKIAEVVLVIPHSNAEQERLFSIVRKNKADSRSNLKLDGTLSSILAMKLQYPESSTPCHEWKPSDEILKHSKEATVKYNKKHE